MIKLANEDVVKLGSTVKTEIDGNKLGITTFTMEGDNLSKKEIKQQAVIALDSIMSHYLDKIWQQYLRTRIAREMKIEEAEELRVQQALTIVDGQVIMDLSASLFKLLPIFFKSYTCEETGMTVVAFGFGNEDKMMDRLTKQLLIDQYNKKIRDHQRKTECPERSKMRDKISSAVSKLAARRKEAAQDRASQRASEPSFGM